MSSIGDLSVSVSLDLKQVQSQLGQLKKLAAPITTTIKLDAKAFRDQIQVIKKLSGDLRSFQVRINTSQAIQALDNLQAKAGALRAELKTLASAGMVKISVEANLTQATKTLEKIEQKIYQPIIKPKVDLSEAQAELGRLGGRLKPAGQPLTAGETAAAVGGVEPEDLFGSTKKRPKKQQQSLPTASQDDFESYFNQVAQEEEKVRKKKAPPLPALDPVARKTTSASADEFEKYFNQQTNAKGFGDQISELANKVLPGFGDQLVSVASGFAAFSVVSVATGFLTDFATSSFRVATELVSLGTALNFAVGGAGSGAIAFKFLRSETERLGVPLQTSIRGFTQLAASTRGTAVEGKATKELFTGLGEAATVLGLNSEQVGGAITALSQIAGKGVVSMEELRGQLGERIPGAMGIAARAMGMTESAFVQLVSTGQVAAEDFLPKFAKQLRSEFGEAAVEASGSAAASINRFENSLFNLQAAFGKAIAPATVGGMKALTALFNLAAPAVGALVTTLTALGVILTVNTIRTLAQAGAFNVLSVAMGKAGISAASFGSALTKGLLAGAAVTIIMSIADAINTGLVQSFEKAAAAAQRTAKASREIKPPASGGPTGLPEVGPDKFINQAASNPFLRFSPGFLTADVAARTANFVKGEGFTRTSFAELQQQRLQESTFTQVAGNADLLSSARSRLTDFRQGRGPSAQLKTVDAELAAAEQERKALQAQVDRDFTRQGKTVDAQTRVRQQQLNDRIRTLSDQRSTLSEPLTQDLSRVNREIESTKSQLAALNDPETVAAVGGEGAASDLRKQLEGSLKALQEFKSTQEATLGSLRVDPILSLTSAFKNLSLNLEEANRKIELLKNQQLGEILNTQLANLQDDPFAAFNAGLQQAQVELQATQSQLAALEEKRDAQAKELADPAKAAALAGLGIKPDASVADIQKEIEATQGDDAKSVGKRRLLEEVKAFKDVESQLAPLRVQAAQKELDLRAQTEKKAVAEIERSAADQEAAIAQTEASKLATIRQSVGLRLLSEEDAAVEIARIQQQSALDTVSTIEAQLAGVDAAFQKGEISRAKFEEDRRKLSTSLAQANLRAAEAEVNAREAVNRKIIEGLKLANQQASASIQRSQTSATIASKSKLLNLSPTVDRPDAERAAEQEQTQIAIKGNQQRVALIQKQIAENEKLFKDKTISEKEYQQEAIRLQQELGQLQEQQVDLQLTRQKQLRDAVVQRINDELAVQKRANDLAVGGLEQQVAARQIISESLDRSKSLLESQASLQKALGDAAVGAAESQLSVLDKVAEARKTIQEGDVSAEDQAQLNQQLAGLGVNVNQSEADFLRLKLQLEDQVAAAKATALQQELAANRTLLQLEQQRQQIAAQQAIDEAQIAKLKAEQAKNEAVANLERAKATGDTRAQKDALVQLQLADQGLAIADRRVGSAQSGAQTQAQLSSNALAAFDINASAQLQQAATAEQLRELTQTLGVIGLKRDNPALAGVTNQISSPFGSGFLGGTPNTVGQLIAQQQGLTFGSQASSPEAAVTGIITTIGGDVVSRLDRLIELANRPAIGTLQVSSPQPVQDAAKVALDVSKQALFLRGEG